MASPKTPRAFQLGLGLLILAGVALRFLPLPLQGLSIDDIFTLTILEPPVSFDSLVLDRAIRIEANPPLYHLLAAGWQALFGQVPIVLKAFGAATGAVALGLAWLLGRGLFPPRVLWMQLALLACSYGAITTALEARPYALLLLFGAVQTCLYFRAERTLREEAGLSAGALLPIALVGALAAYTHYFGLIFTGAAFALLLLQVLRSPKDAVRVVGFGLLTLLLFAPWLTHELPRQQTIMAELSLFWFPDTAGEVFRQAVLFSAYLGSGAVPTLILFLACAGALAPALPRWREAAVWPDLRRVLHCAALAAITLALAAFLNLFAPMTFARYFVVLLPALYLGIASSFALGLVWAEARGWPLPAYGAVLLLTAMLLHTTPYLLRERGDHWSDAVAFIHDELGCDSGAVPVYQPYGFADGLVAFDYRLKQRSAALSAGTIEGPEGRLAPLAEADPECRLVAWVDDGYFRTTNIAERLAHDLGVEIDPRSFAAESPFESRVFGSNVLVYRP